MEDFNSKYTGEQVESLLDMVANGEAGGGGGGIAIETDPIFSASPAASITDAKKTEWDGKQDAIADLATIRSGAEKGATALQSVPSEYGTKAWVTEQARDIANDAVGDFEAVAVEPLAVEILSLRESLDTLVSGDTTTAIKTFNEVIAFLEGIADTENLAGIIASIEKQLLWTKAEGEAGVRLKGTNGTATGNFAISAGDDKTASDGTPYTSAASGDHAVAFGFGNTCAGRSTLAQGLYNIVNGKDSVAFGQRNLVNGDQAFAAGQQNEVSTRLGVTLGYQNKSTNTNSIAIGYKNTSSGSGSVALGDTCESSGTSSTAMGYKTKATGAYSATFGENTQATNSGEVAMGSYNKSTTSTDAAEQTLFSFGIGTSDTVRSNALEIKKNGNVYIGDELLNEKMSVWDGKQDIISDLATIREGASKGATALQSVPSEYGTKAWVTEQARDIANDAVGDFEAVAVEPLAEDVSQLKGAIGNKVDKVTGKGLSAEDFTTVLKSKLEGLSNYDDTALNNAVSTLRGDFDKLVSGDTTTAIKTFNEVIAFLDGISDSEDLDSIIAGIEQQIASKQDTISDLATIRSGAAKGATALQSYTEKYTGTITGITMNGVSKGTSGVVDLGTVITAHQDISGKADKSSLATVATSGSYNDLSNKPTIPSAVTESTVSGWGFTKNTGTYSKPSGGIPKNDLSSAVQASLDKADAAVPIYTVKDSVYAKANGVADDQYAYALPSSANGDEDDIIVTRNTLKTINGESLIGSGNITISGGGVSEEYVNNAIADAITKTLNTPI